MHLFLSSWRFLKRFTCFHITVFHETFMNLDGVFEKTGWSKDVIHKARVLTSSNMPFLKSISSVRLWQRFSRSMRIRVSSPSCFLAWARPVSSWHHTQTLTSVFTGSFYQLLLFQSFLDFLPPGSAPAGRPVWPPDLSSQTWLWPSGHLWSSAGPPGPSVWPELLQPPSPSCCS